MQRHVGWVFGAGLLFIGLAAPASAQVHVDVGVVLPHVGARVVIGGPSVVYVADPYRGPVYVRRDVYSRYDRWDRGRGHGWNRRGREYHKDVRDARRDYERDIREARRDYERDIREARRDYQR